METKRAKDGIEKVGFEIEAATISARSVRTRQAFVEGKRRDRHGFGRILAILFDNTLKGFNVFANIPNFPQLLYNGAFERIARRRFEKRIGAFRGRYLTANRL